MKLYDYQRGAEVTEVDEGRSVIVYVEIEGPFYGSGPFPEGMELVVSADSDFDGVPEVHKEIVVQSYSPSWISYSFPDDGRFDEHGNYVPADDLVISVTFNGHTETRDLTVKNVAPVFTSNAGFSISADEDGNKAANVSFSFTDIGIHDRHTAVVTWADGVKSELDFECDGSEGHGSNAEIVCNGDVVYAEISRDLSDSPDAELLPFTISVFDDDHDFGNGGIGGTGGGGTGGGDGEGGGSAEMSFGKVDLLVNSCLLYTSPSPRDQRGSRMPSSA